MAENLYNFLQKQTYTQRELTEQMTVTQNNKSCVCDTYNMPNWTDETYTNLIDILDHIYEDYITVGQDGYCEFGVIYNNIIVKVNNDSVISQSTVAFSYIPAQVDMRDLNEIKQIFFAAFSSPPPRLALNHKKVFQAEVC